RRIVGQRALDRIDADDPRFAHVVSCLTKIPSRIGNENITQAVVIPGSPSLYRRWNPESSFSRMEDRQLGSGCCLQKAQAAAE
ncbi:MAG: hypothetical protein KGK35_08755, partial [Xanthomonadaceae bacterium]|nr:hypothetical protein [Xanthomonadaceae bacterium]